MHIFITILRFAHFYRGIFLMKPKYINLDSNKQEVSKTIAGFPFSCYYSQFCTDTYEYIDWHWHTEFQLCLTISGTVIWSTGESHSYVSAGEGIFINSQRAHSAKPLAGEASFFCIDIPPDFICPEKESPLYESSIRPILFERSLDRKQISGKTAQGAEILCLLSQMADAFSAQAKGYEFMLAGSVFLLWNILRQYLAEDIKNIPSSENDRFQIFLAFLQKNYAHEIPLAEIARHVGLSRSECCRYFKKKTGQTISDYLRQYRIRKSFDLLLETDDTISFIAQNCGFSSQSYYTKEFRRLTGLSPRQYRSAHKEK